MVRKVWLAAAQGCAGCRRPQCSLYTIYGVEVKVSILASGREKRIRVRPKVKLVADEMKAELRFFFEKNDGFNQKPAKFYLMLQKTRLGKSGCERQGHTKKQRP
jgi:hypothetical protein